VAKQFQSKVAIFLPDPKGRLLGRKGEVPEGFSQDGTGVAQWAYDHQEAAGMGTDILPGAEALYQPLIGAKGILGVLGVRPEGVPRWMEPDQRHLLEAFANQTALALERANLADQHAESQRHQDQERMRSALLSSVSQELQAPLQGISETSRKLQEGTTGSAQEMASEIQGAAHQLQRLVDNLLLATRLEGDVLETRKDWVPAEEVLAAARRRLGAGLGHREVKVELPATLPPLFVDAGLMEQALANLLENAHRYSPLDEPVEIKGWATDRAVTLAVADHGPGIPSGQEERVFEKLVKFPQGRIQAGAGLGLAVSKGIVEAHGGWIQAGTRPSGGAQILLSLPLGEEAPAKPAPPPPIP